MPAYIKRNKPEAFLGSRVNHIRFFPRQGGVRISLIANLRSQLMRLLLDKAHFSFIIELVLITQISFISEIRVIYFHNLCQVC